MPSFCLFDHILDPLFLSDLYPSYTFRNIRIFNFISSSSLLITTMLDLNLSVPHHALHLTNACFNTCLYSSLSDLSSTARHITIIDERSKYKFRSSRRQDRKTWRCRVGHRDHTFCGHIGYVAGCCSWAGRWWWWYDVMSARMWSSRREYVTWALTTFRFYFLHASIMSQPPNRKIYLI